MALNDFHKKLEAFYQTYTGSQRLYYERRSKQYANMSEIEKVRVVTIATQIKAFSSMFLDKPHLASRYYGRLIKDSSGIFDTNHKLIPYYTSAYILYKVEFLIRNRQIDQIYNRYRYHILMIIKYLFLGKNTQPNLNSHDMDRLCQRILDAMNDPEQLQKYIAQAIAIISGQVPDILNPENAKTLAVVEKIRDSIE